MTEDLFANASGRRGQCPFTAMKPKVGQRIEFQIAPAALHPRLFTHLIGYEPGESVLVRTPLENHLPVNVHEGQAVLVRCFDGTRAYAFETTVQRICIAPFLYLHLAYPPEVQYLQVRQAARVPVRFLAEVRAQASWQPALVLDLGLGGALLETSHALGETGSPVEVRLAIPVDSTQAEVPMTLVARLQRIDRHQEGAGPPVWRQGVKFEGCGREERMRLQNFLLRQMLEG